MISIYSMPTFLTAIMIVILGVFVFIKNPKSILNRLFFFVCINGIIWFVGYGIVYSCKNVNTALFWARFSYIGIVFIATADLHFALAFIGIDKEKRPLIVATYIYSIIFLLISRTNIFLNGMNKFFWGYYPTVSYAYYIYLILFYCIYALIPFYLYQYIWGRKKMKNATPSKIIQSKYIFWAFVIALPASMDYYAKFGFEIYPAGYFFMLCFISVLAYAIVRHQLMDIEVVIKKTLVFTGLLATVFAIIVLPTLIIQEYIIGRAGFGVRLTGLMISVTMIIFAMRKIEDFLVNITDKFLFQKKYDYKELLRTFTDEVLTVLDFNKLVKLTVAKLTDIMKLQSCGILVLDERKGEYHLTASQGIKEKRAALPADNTLISFLSRTKSHLSVAEFDKVSSDVYKRMKDLREDMNRLKFELAIPLITLQGDMIGVLTLGKKKSDEDYTQDDMDILIPLARTLAIAISNAEMFAELGKTQAEAAQRDKMAVIGTLSAGINHEICNPLGIARGQCEAFLLNMKDGLYKSKTQKELIEKAQTIMGKVIHETDRATAITKRLSSFAKPSKGIISDDISIKDEMDEVLALVSYEMRLDRVDIVKEIDEHLSFISADRKALQQVFFNLVRNAAQAIKEKGRITVRAKEVGGKIVVQIEDTGEGIPEDKVAEVFNPFYTTKEPGKGTGLGLFIVRQVVERNRGRISVKSKIGEGTTFTLEFPAATKTVV